MSSKRKRKRGMKSVGRRKSRKIKKNDDVSTKHNPYDEYWTKGDESYVDSETTNNCAPKRLKVNFNRSAEVRDFLVNFFNLEKSSSACFSSKELYQHYIKKNEESAQYNEGHITKVIRKSANKLCKENVLVKEESKYVVMFRRNSELDNMVQVSSDEEESNQEEEEEEEEAVGDSSFVFRNFATQILSIHRKLSKQEIVEEYIERNSTSSTREEIEKEITKSIDSLVNEDILKREKLIFLPHQPIVYFLKESIDEDEDDDDDEEEDVVPIVMLDENEDDESAENQSNVFSSEEFSKQIIKLLEQSKSKELLKLLKKNFGKFIKKRPREIDIGIEISEILDSSSPITSKIREFSLHHFKEISERSDFCFKMVSYFLKTIVNVEDKNESDLSGASIMDLLKYYVIECDFGDIHSLVEGFFTRYTFNELEKEYFSFEEFLGNEENRLIILLSKLFRKIPFILQSEQNKGKFIKMMFKTVIYFKFQISVSDGEDNRINVVSSFQNLESNVEEEEVEGEVVESTFEEDMEKRKFDNSKKVNRSKNRQRGALMVAPPPTDKGVHPEYSGKFPKTSVSLSTKNKIFLEGVRSCCGKLVKQVEGTGKSQYGSGHLFVNGCCGTTLWDGDVCTLAICKCASRAMWCGKVGCQKEMNLDNIDFCVYCDNFFHSKCLIKDSEDRYGSYCENCKNEILQE